MHQEEAYNHQEDKRTYIPSAEEAGTEKYNPKVKDAEAETTYDRRPKHYCGSNPLEKFPDKLGDNPELLWAGKYGDDLDEPQTHVPNRALYRAEHIQPDYILKQLYKAHEKGSNGSQTTLADYFGNYAEKDELEKPHGYYQWPEPWTNRMIQGDSLMVMNSLLRREGMAGQVQCIYIDPPYGIKYGSNWQMKLSDRTVTDGKDEYLSGEPEVIKAYRDTWQMGIHSYLSYMRDRLETAHELLSETGSCFVQISNENVHLIRILMDEVFSPENFISEITVRKRSPQPDAVLPSVSDYLIWFSKNKESFTTSKKYKQLYTEKNIGEAGSSGYKNIMLTNGETRPAKKSELFDPKSVPDGARFFSKGDLTSSHFYKSPAFTFNGKTYTPGKRYWSTSIQGLERLGELGRLITGDKGNLSYIRYFDDFPMLLMSNIWNDTQGSPNKNYVVQTSESVIERCILMTTDPGDLVLDPTCGSGTTAHVAEEWGRRWITIDTSRIALNIAKKRLMTATFPYYHLYSDIASVEYPKAEQGGKLIPKVKPLPEKEQPHDVRQGFVYEKVPHITLKSLANDQPLEMVTLFDQPLPDNKRMRVSGPFTVETLQRFNPISPEEASQKGGIARHTDTQAFEEQLFAQLQKSGIKTGRKDETVRLYSLRRLSSAVLHVEAFFNSDEGEKKVYLHVGPQFDAVSKQAISAAIKECRRMGDADWLVILGFSFEANTENQNVTTSVGNIAVTKVRMDDALMQGGLRKHDTKTASFITIGEPDIVLHTVEEEQVQVEIRGLDIYDPITDQLKPRDVSEIAYWMVDDQYDGSNFVARQVFFCGSESRKEFNDWRKGLDKEAKRQTQRNAEHTLRIEIDEEAFDRMYGHLSHPIKTKGESHQIAVRVVSQFGEESTKVLQAGK